MINRSAVIAQAIRMVVPMRHVLSTQLDIKRLLDDDAYARSVVSLAGSSRDAALEAYGAELHRLRFPPVAAVPLGAAGSAQGPLHGRYRAGLR